MGIERLLELIVKEDKKEESLYLGAMDENALNILTSLASSKRKTIKTSLEYTSRNFNKHFKLAQKQNVSMIALIGEEELKNNTIYTKNMITGEEKTISLEDFIIE